MAYLIGTALSQRGDPQARTYYWQAVQSHPLYWRAWLRLLLPGRCQSRPDSGSECKLSASSNPVDSRFALLDVLRGLAVLAVIALHSGDHARGHGVPWFEELLWPVLRHGYLGVQLFFAISGYCIIGAVDSAMRGPSPIWTFVRRRVRRIYPPFWFSIVFAIGLGALTVGIMKRSWWDVFPLTAFDWLLNVMLLQGPFAAPDAVMVYWSLTVEVQFYAVMAVCLVLPRWRSVWLVGLSMFYVLWAWRSFVPIAGTPLAYWPEFACGIAAYVAHHPRAFMPGTQWLLWGLSALAIVVGWNRMTETVSADGELATPIKQLFCLGCGLLIWRLRGFDALIDRVWLLRTLSFIGVISYSLYLTHVPIATRVFNLAGRLSLLDGTRWYAVAAIAGALQLGVGWLFYRCCEQPWVNRKNHAKPVDPQRTVESNVPLLELVAR